MEDLDDRRKPDLVLSESFIAAALQILGADETPLAAQQLEGIVIEDYMGDSRFDDLLFGLALYIPGGKNPYIDAPELRKLIKDVLRSFGKLPGDGLMTIP